MNNKVPKLILAMEPKPLTPINNFFKEEGNKLVELLKDPPHLRYSGWNLLTLDRPKIEGGQYWEVKNGDRKTIRIYKDGSVVTVAYADNTFLAWGRNEEEYMKLPRLNTLALTEYVYEFSNFITQVIRNLPNTKSVTIKVSMINTQLDADHSLCIYPGEISDFLYSFDHFDDVNKLKSDFESEINIEITRDGQEVNPDAGIVAFKILSDILSHFGVPSDRVPYQKTLEDGSASIDFQRIESIR